MVKTSGNIDLRDLKLRDRAIWVHPQNTHAIFRNEVLGEIISRLEPTKKSYPIYGKNEDIDRRDGIIFQRQFIFRGVSNRFYLQKTSGGMTLPVLIQQGKLAFNIVAPAVIDEYLLWYRLAKIVCALLNKELDEG